MSEKSIEDIIKEARHLPLFLSLKTVMREGNCSESHLQRILKSGELESIKRGKRRLVPKHAFLKWAYKSDEETIAA